MKEIFKALGKFGLEILKEMDYKKLLYKAYNEIIKAKLEKLVADSESKIDDVILAGFNQLVEKFLKPEIKEIEHK